MTRPASRERRERFIETFDTLTGRDFDRALKACMHRAGGLGFFTDEQLEQIAAEMARAARSRHSHMIRERSAHWMRVANAVEGIRTDLRDIIGRAA